MFLYLKSVRTNTFILHFLNIISNSNRATWKNRNWYGFNQCGYANCRKSPQRHGAVLWNFPQVLEKVCFMIAWLCLPIFAYAINRKILNYRNLDLFHFVHRAKIWIFKPYVSLKVLRPSKNKPTGNEFTSFLICHFCFV